MAYLGSTSSSPNFPALAYGVLSGPQEWRYASTHVSSDLSFANFFADGVALGMKLGDRLIHVGSTTILMSVHVVDTIGSTGGVAVSTGSTI